MNVEISHFKEFQIFPTETLVLPNPHLVQKKIHPFIIDVYQQQCFIPTKRIN